MRRLIRRGARPLRWLLIGTGPLKRGSDRVEMAFRFLVLAAFFASVPVGLVVGTAMQRHESALAAAQARDRHTVSATVLADPTVEGTSDTDTVTAAVAWTTDDGSQRTGMVPVPVSAHAGTPVTVWVTADGRATSAPLDPSTVLGDAVWGGILAGLGAPLLAGCLLWLLRGALAVRRQRQWEADWQAVEPLWTSRGR